MKLASVPSEEDWGEYEADLDQKYAHEMFAGKNLDEALSQFDEGVIDVVDKLRFMPVTPFRYYMLALRNYVMSERALVSDMAPDAASSFLNLVEEKIRNSPESIRPIMDAIVPAVEYVAANQTLFGADVDIYGSFADKLAEIRKLYEKHTSGSRR